MLTLTHISKDYGKFRAVNDINLEMEQGLYGMLAPNGAGKTTLIKMMTTLLFPTEGEILYNGMPVEKMGEAYRDLIGYLPQHFGYYKNNTPTQYLDYLSALKGMPKEGLKEKIAELLEMVGLSSEEYLDRELSGSLSGGELKRIEIASVLTRDSKLMIFDKNA